MIRSFRHKGLESFFRHGSKAGIQAKQAAKLRLQLTVSGNWRIVFRFVGKDLELVDCLDYH